MPLYLNQSVSSRITKPASSQTARRPATSSLASLQKTKPTLRKSSAIEAELEDGEDEHENELKGTGKVVTTLGVPTVRDVQTAVAYATKFMFSPLPDRAGMNSVKRAEVLNFQRYLPAVVSLAHVHALIAASSRTEREIQSLQTTGKLLKLRVTGRGNDMTGLSEILILTLDYEQMLEGANVDAVVIATFLSFLKQHTRSQSIAARDLPLAHVQTLTRHGFLVSSSLDGRATALSGSSHTSIPTISRQASGSSAAVGGGAALEILGGVGGPKKSSSNPEATPSQTSQLSLSVPNLGAYLRLLDSGRTHLMDLLHASKHRQAPVYLLREKWDGAVDSDSRISQAKQIRGEHSAILPAKTKKWKHLHGLTFDWTLAECLGAGMIELFETHAVGLGVRSLI